MGKLIELPKNEKPTVATVLDKTKLVDQPVFANAENGDKVLIYQGGQYALLYRPSTNKIISIGALNIAPQAQASPSPTVLPTAIVSPTAKPSVKSSR